MVLENGTGDRGSEKPKIEGGFSKPMTDERMDELRQKFDLDKKEESENSIEKQNLQEDFKKLYENLKDKLNNKCYFIKNNSDIEIYLLGNKGENDTQLISHNDELQDSLKNLFYNNYNKNNIIDNPQSNQIDKYHAPKYDQDAHAITRKTIEESSFVLKDFLEDLKNAI